MGQSKPYLRPQGGRTLKGWFSRCILVSIIYYLSDAPFNQCIVPVPTKGPVFLEICWLSSSNHRNKVYKNDIVKYKNILRKMFKKHVNKQYPPFPPGEQHFKLV